jgi:hypothetical protein
VHIAGTLGKRLSVPSVRVAIHALNGIAISVNHGSGLSISFMRDVALGPCSST